jgi:hypothetical protein
MHRTNDVATNRAKPVPAQRNPWYTKERRCALLCARGLANGRFETEAAAIRACRAALARAGLGRRYTIEAVRQQIRLESRRLVGPPSRAYWTPSEYRVIERFARALVRREYPSATAAARVCLKVLARHKRHFSRSVVVVAVRISERALELGRKHTRANFTSEEWKVLRELAPEVSSGRFREVRDASRTFLAIMARRRRARTDGSNIPVRTVESVDQKFTRVARELGLAWGFRDWSPEEDRVADQFIDRYSKGEFRSLRSTARACRVELRRLDAERRKHPERGRPFGRSFLAIRQHLKLRTAERGITMPLFRRWQGPEGRIAARYAELFAADGGRHTIWDFATMLQRALRRRGYQRTLDACKAEIGRARVRMQGLL